MFGQLQITLSQMLLGVIVTILGLIIARYHIKRMRMYKMAKGIKGPRRYPIIGSAHLFAGSTESKYLHL